MNYFFTITLFVSLYILYQYYKKIPNNKNNRSLGGIEIVSVGCFGNIDYDKISGRVYEITTNNDWISAVTEVLKLYPEISKYMDITMSIYDASNLDIAYTAYLLGYKYISIRKSKDDKFGQVRVIWSEQLPKNPKTNKLVKSLNFKTGHFPKLGTCKFDELKKDPITKRLIFSADKKGESCCGHPCMKKSNGKRVPDTFMDRDGVTRQIMCGGADYNFIGDSRWEITEIKPIFD